MPKQNIISGIDIGSSKITTIIAQVVSDEVSFQRNVNVVGVSSVESRGIKKGQIVDIEEAVDAIVASVEGAERMAGYNLDTSFISLGGAHIASQNSHGVVAVSSTDGEITEEDVERVIEAASAVSMPSSRELIHVVPREFIVDGEAGIKDPVGMTGVRLEVETHLITASSAAIKNLKKALNEVGVNVSGMVFTGLAASDAVVTKTEKELGCCVIDIGSGTTSIAAFDDGALTYSGVIPIGSKNVTNDLAIGLRISLESAEKIKKMLSESEKKPKKKETIEDELDLQSLGVIDIRRVSRKTLIEGIIRPRLNEIFTMVRIALEKEGLATRIPAGVVITGGGAETIGAIESAKRMLSLPVRIGEPKGVDGLIDDIITPSYSTAVGLVLQPTEKSEKESPFALSKKLKSFPGKDILTKVIEMVKDLLP